MDTSGTFWSAVGDHVSLNGFMETGQAMRVRGNHNLTSSFMRGRLESHMSWSNFSGFLSAEAEWNKRVDDLSGVRLREAWLGYDADSWDIRVGRQIIIWGRADGVRITDNISPPDYRDMILRGMEDTHKPVMALKLRTLGENITSEFIWKPYFEPLDMPYEKGAWALNMGLDEVASYMDVVVCDDDRHPHRGLSDSEFAFKVSRSGAGFDVSASYFYGRDNQPTFIPMISMGENGRPSAMLVPKHYRVSIYGVDVAVPWKKVVLRGEAALISGRRFYHDDMSLKKGNLFKYLVGVDWNMGSGWNATMQFTDDWALMNTADITQDRHKPLVTFSISKKCFRDTLTLKEQLFAYLHDGQHLNRISAEYEFCDGFKGSVGFDYFKTSDSSYYKNFRKNNQVWAKLRYSF